MRGCLSCGKEIVQSDRWREVFQIAGCEDAAGAIEAEPGWGGLSNVGMAGGGFGDVGYKRPRTGMKLAVSFWAGLEWCVECF
jgi:hypothetical protein